MLLSSLEALSLSGSAAAALYFVLIRPQLRRVLKRQKFVMSFKIGDRVVTGGGLIGQIVGCNETIVSISFAGVGTIDDLLATVQSSNFCSA